MSAVFEQCSSSVNAALAIVNNVLPQVEEMTKGARAIKNIETSIHFLSMNAAIQTTRLGNEGAAMGAIASELRSITKNSEGNIRIVLDGLNAINEALAKITGEEAISENSLMMDGRGDIVRGELAGLSNLSGVPARK